MSGLIFVLLPFQWRRRQDPVGAEVGIKDSPVEQVRSLQFTSMKN